MPLSAYFHAFVPDKILKQNKFIKIDDLTGMDVTYPPQIFYAIVCLF